MEVLKISSKSNPNSVAGAIAGLVKENNYAEMQAIGAGALNQAVKAVAIGNADYKRRGIAFKSINLVLKYGFSELNLNKVYLNVDAENTAACRLYEKVGLEQEGFFVQDLLHNNKLIDRKRYAIIRQNFSERNL